MNNIETDEFPDVLVGCHESSPWKWPSRADNFATHVTFSKSVHAETVTTITTLPPAAVFFDTSPSGFANPAVADAPDLTMAQVQQAGQVAGLADVAQSYFNRAENFRHRADGKSPRQRKKAEASARAIEGQAKSWEARVRAECERIGFELHPSAVLDTGVDAPVTQAAAAGAALPPSPDRPHRKATNFHLAPALARTVAIAALMLTHKTANAQASTDPCVWQGYQGHEISFLFKLPQGAKACWDGDPTQQSPFSEGERDAWTPTRTLWLRDLASGAVVEVYADRYCTGAPGNCEGITVDTLARSAYTNLGMMGGAFRLMADGDGNLALQFPAKGDIRGALEIIPETRDAVMRPSRDTHGLLDRLHGSMKTLIICIGGSGMSGLFLFLPGILADRQRNRDSANDSSGLAARAEARRQKQKALIQETQQENNDKDLAVALRGVVNDESKPLQDRLAAAYQYLKDFMPNSIFTPSVIAQKDALEAKMHAKNAARSAERSAERAQRAGQLVEMLWNNLLELIQREQ